MQILVATVLALAVVQPSAAQTRTAQQELDELSAQLRDARKESTELDESDRKLAQSNQVQAETHRMLTRAEERIRAEEVPRIVERGRAADVTRQRIIDSGCPPHGGEVPLAVAQRCNPMIGAHAAEVQRIEADALELRNRLATIERTREAANETTIANARQQSANNARRNELQARQAQLRVQMIQRAVSAHEKRAKATEACKALTPLENAHCCLSVVSDGASPTRCGPEPIYQAFERAGVFGSAVVRPVSR